MIRIKKIKIHHKSKKVKGKSKKLCHAALLRRDDTNKPKIQNVNEKWQMKDEKQSTDYTDFHGWIIYFILKNK